MAEGGELGGECAAAFACLEVSECGRGNCNKSVKGRLAKLKCGKRKYSACTASESRPWTFCLQQPWDAGMRMLLQRPFIILQQACSSVVIWAPGIAHAIAGTSVDKASITTTAILRNRSTYFRVAQRERLVSATQCGAVKGLSG
jgi:hypothetical protein